jgi:alpha-tubulin suppressor-like RCC1 family protein
VTGEFEIPIETKGEVIQIACGNNHALILTSINEVFVFGSNACGQLGLGETRGNIGPVKLQIPGSVRSISCGIYFSMILMENGDLFGFGYNMAGQISASNHIGHINVPSLIMSDVKSMECCGNHTIVEKTCGDLWSFGDNKFEQLGVPHNKESPHGPFKIWDGVRDGKVLQVSGNFHTAILTESSVTLFGCNTDGECGIAFPPNTKKHVLSMPIKQISCGVDSTILLLENNRLLVFGRNDKGQLCSELLTKSLQPTEICFSEKIKHVQCFDSHTLILYESGELVGFGLNNKGQLGSSNPLETKRVICSNVDLIPGMFENRRWTIHTHKRFPQILQRQIFTFLLVNKRRMMETRTGVHRFITYMIFKYLI